MAELAIQPPLSNPYVGPRTFTEQDGLFFFGREREARELLSLVIAEPLVLFYAQSGAGKSSLINTRLRPGLRQEGFDLWPIGRVSGELPAGVSHVDNLFVFNLLLDLNQNQTQAASLTHLCLADYLQAHPPAPTAAIDTDEQPPGRVLIIDQFEEIITSHLERWPEREDFFRQLNQALTADPLLWIVLTMREDYVAALDPYARLLPGKLRARFYMPRLGYQAARQAIAQPARHAGRPFAPGVAETLVDNLRQLRALPGQTETPLGEFVEPVQLQVVCYQLWQNLIHRSPAAITQQDIQELGNVDTALAQFYEQALAKVLAQTGESEIGLRNWFERQLMTEAGTRGMVYQGQTHTGGLSNRTVELLANQFLLRAEIRGGGTWYELVHDRFIEPILQANRAWRERQSSLVQAALTWVAAGRPEAGLYHGPTLQAALTTTATQRLEPLVAEFLAASEKFSQALQEKEMIRQRELKHAQALAAAERQRAEEQSRSAARLRRLAIALAVIFLLAVGATIWAIKKQQQAEAQTQLAQAETQRAEAQTQLAKTEAQRAEAQTKLAKARALSAAALTHLATDPELSILLAHQAITISKDTNSTQTLQQAIQSSRVRRTFTGHHASLTAVAFSRDENRLATSGQDGQAIIWDIASGQPAPLLDGHQGQPFWTVAFSPDGTQLVSGGQDQTAIVWDLTTKQAAFTLTDHAGSVWAATFSPNGKHLAIAVSATITIWDVTSWKQQTTLSGHTAEITSLAFRADSRYLASGSADKTVRIWDIASGKSVLTLTNRHTDVIWTVAFSPNGQRLAIGSGDKTVHIEELQNNAAGDPTSTKPLLTLSQSNEVFAVAFSPDGRRLATGGADGAARIWNATSYQLLLTLAGHTAGVRSVAFNTTGDRLATASDDGTARIWDIAGHSQGAVDVAFHPKSNQLATSSEDGTILLWQRVLSPNGDIILHPIQELRARPEDAPPEKPQPETPPPHRCPPGDPSCEREQRPAEPQKFTAHPEITGSQLVRRIAFSPDGHYLATAYSDNTAKIWAIASGQLLLTLTGHTDAVYGVAFSPNGARLLTGSKDYTARVWSLTFTPTISAQTIVTLTGHTKWVNEVAFSPDGTYLATASSDKTAKVWVAETGKLSFTLAHSPAIDLNSIAFNPTGNRLATAGADGTAMVWDMETGRSVLTLTGHSNWIRDISFSADGTRLATASYDKTAKIWDVATGTLLLTLNNDTEVNSVAFSPDNKHLTTTNADGTLHLYPLTADTLLNLAQARLTRSLRDAECQVYLSLEACPAP